MTYSFSPATSKLVVSVSDGLATLAIDNPSKHNAVDLEMWKALPGSWRPSTGTRRCASSSCGERAGNPSPRAPISREFATVRADAEGRAAL